MKNGMIIVCPVNQNKQINMFDKYIYQGLHFSMKWSGQINSWAWRKHARILRDKQKIAMDKLTRNQENNAYLEELKRKL